jgi:hypothetical protein
LFAEKMAAVDTSFLPSMNEASDQTAGAIPECPADYPPLSYFVWPTDQDDEAILACTSSSNLTTTTLAPTVTTPPVDSMTESPTVASIGNTTYMPTVEEETFMPTTQPTEAATTNQPTSDADTTRQPTALSDVETTDQPTTFSAIFETAIPAEQPTTAEVQESCMLNPTCAAQNGLRVAGVQSCCPTRDERNLYLDCCATVADFCYNDAGSITVCRSVSTSQYLSEVITGQRNPNSVNTDESGTAATKTCLLFPFCTFFTGALILMSILA